MGRSESDKWWAQSVCALHLKAQKWRVAGAWRLLCFLPPPQPPSFGCQVNPGRSGRQGHKLYKKIVELKTEDVELLFRDSSYGRWQQQMAILSDARLLAVSAAVVFIIILLHTQSLFLGFMGFLEIIFSLPLAYFVYRVIFGVNYFHFLNFLGLFIMLGIGADDIFMLGLLRWG